MTTKPTVNVPVDPGCAAVTVVPESESVGYSLMPESVVLVDDQPRSSMAVFAFVTALIAAVAEVAAASDTVPYWTLLIRLVVSPSTITPVTRTVPAVPVLRVAVIVVELVSVMRAKSSAGLFDTDGLMPSLIINAPAPTALIVAVLVVWPDAMVIENFWTPTEVRKPDTYVPALIADPAIVPPDFIIGCAPVAAMTVLT
jgi:hypothetical protein